MATVIDEPLQTNAADPEQIREAAREERLEVNAEKGRWHTQLSTYEGRQFLWDEILADMALDEHIETHEVQKLGVRNRGLKFKAMAQAHTELWLQMQAEALKRASTRNRARRERRTTTREN